MKQFLLFIFSWVVVGVYAQIDTPIVNTTPASCVSDGTAFITNANANYTYTFSPSGPVWTSSGQIIGMQCGTSYTVTASEGGQTSPASSPFSIECQLPVPNPQLTDGFICIENGSNNVIQTFFLDSGLDPSTHSFLWTVNGQLLLDEFGNEITTSTHDAVLPGVYSVNATNIWGCVSEVNAIVEGHNNPVITNLQVANSTVIVNVSGTGNYNYRINNGNWQQINVFNNVPQGNFMVEVLNDCGADSQTGFNPDIPVPIISVTPPTCISNGTASITNYNPNYTYIFSPTGPVWTNTGQIVGLQCGTSYTVTASGGGQTSPASAPFSIECQLPVPSTPSLIVTDPSCFNDSQVFITNYDPNYIYTFNPVGPTINLDTFEISGAVPGIVYNLSVSNFNGCTNLVNFIVNPQIPNPSVPIINVVGATCELGGTPQIMNFNLNCTYTFFPSGPIVVSTGWIQNYVDFQDYIVTVTCGGCTSEPSVVFNNGPLPTPETPTIQITNPSCENPSGLTVTNYMGNLTYIFTPNDNSIFINNLGQIIGGQVGQTYSVEASNGFCSSQAPSETFTIVPEFSIPDSPMIATTGATCDFDGTATNTNYNATFTYVFTPTGPSMSTGGLIIGAECGVFYTVTAVSSNGCQSMPSIPFFIACAFTIPAAPQVCVTNQGAFISNYSPDLFYIFTPNVPNALITSNGLILGLTPGVNYTVQAGNGVTCNSNPSNVFNISEPNNCNAITLIAFLDTNNNGIKDSDEVNFNFGYFTYTINGGGLQNGYTNNGVYIIQDNNPENVYNLNFVVQSYAQYYSNSTSYTNININGDNTYYFPIVSTDLNYQDLSVHILPSMAPRAGFDYYNVIRYKNNSPSIVSTGTITFTKDPVITLNHTSPSSTTTTTGFTYSFTDLLPFETRYITVNMFTPPLPTVQLNQPITHSVSIEPLTNDVNPDNNQFSLTQGVIAAYDPNDKMEARGPRVVFADYNPNDDFTYTIRFENEGNASAINIRITDELNAKIDENSLRMVDASHPYQLERISNQLTWRFDNINLPVSVPNTMIGHGHVTFSVKMKPGIQLNDEVPNFASIYFDTNPPIITNTFVTWFYDPLSVTTFNNQVSIYPNPTNNLINIQSKYQMEAVKLFDLQGKELVSKNYIQDVNTQLSLDNLSGGVYFLKIKTAEGESVHKVVKR